MQKAILKDVPELRDVVGRTGSDQLGLDPMRLNETDTFITFKDREAWRKKDPACIVGQLREVMKRFPGGESSFTQPVEIRTDGMLAGARGAVIVERENGERNATVQIKVENRALVAFVEDAQQAVQQQVKLPDGCRIAWATSSRSSSVRRRGWCW